MKNYLWNMFANIQNGQMANKVFILQRQTKICSSFLNILWNEGYILGYKIDSLDKKKFKIFLKYKNNKPVITALKSFSTPGNRIYLNTKQLWKISSIEGLLIISTNKGLLTLSECKKKKVGGEPFVIVK
uniref:Ribosomal protein S8 n=1 Tax=Eucampia zodiacus TaxID=444606 RepID=A0A7T0GG35_9STRA|nr:ribosomal protein S8 [Eucampia zodiacus]QPJ79924.1 ribosomal protein S8 [Eucampia zodiacus]